VEGKTFPTPPLSLRDINSRWLGEKEELRWKGKERKKRGGNTARHPKLCPLFFSLLRRRLGGGGSGKGCHSKRKWKKKKKSVFLYSLRQPPYRKSDNERRKIQKKPGTLCRREGKKRERERELIRLGVNRCRQFFQ